MPSSGEDGKEDGNPNENEPKADATRRNFLKAGLAFVVGLVILGIGAVSKSLFAPSEAFSTETSTSSATTSTASKAGIPPSTPGFPVIMVANVSDLQVNRVEYFYYPLTDTPNILVKLGTKATGGVGPDGDIVAFSQICQHLGCSVGYVGAGDSPACDSSYTAAGPEGYCCCHGSAYDLTNGMKVTGGPAPRPLPQVILKVDDAGNIYATGMTSPTIFGYNTGSDDVSADLSGGTIVS